MIRSQRPERTRPWRSRRPLVRALLSLLAAGLLASILAWPLGARGARGRRARTRPAPISLLGPLPRGDALPSIGSRPGDEALAGLRLRPAMQHAADRVIVVSVDGLRPDSLGDRPTYQRLLAAGASAREGRTLERSLTLPSHASMVTGVGIERHGLGFNSHRRSRRIRSRFPSIFRIARAAGYPTAMFVGKHKLEHLTQDEDLDRFEVGGSFCPRVNARAIPWLARMRTGLAFVHYPDPDGAGHRDGWLSAGYERAVRRTDSCMAELLTTLAASGDMRRTLILITSDHGGHGRTHGSAQSEDTRIPWMAFGGAATRGELPQLVQTLDTAPTVLRALGLPIPRGIEGSVVAGALRPER